jgi:hypothetical protein
MKMLAQNRPPEPLSPSEPSQIPLYIDEPLQDPYHSTNLYQPLIDLIINRGIIEYSDADGTWKEAINKESSV